MRGPVFRAAFEGELVIDNFAGGGGASTGIEMALGRPVDIAINHSPEAIAMHRANHPGTKHYCENIFNVDPREACGGRPVGLAWFSPDCTHFSRAKGKKPRSKNIRALANVVIDWARDVRPRVIMLENVEEFQTWGPLDKDGHPIKSREGEDFDAWIGALSDLGYKIDMRTMVAADYGTPTTRKRLFIVARLDTRGAWPEPTHGAECPSPWRTAAEIIDWSYSVPSIFTRKRPLAEKTLRRWARPAILAKILAK
jgi:DNA (cytosine-5)-methyltransferase 1